LETLESLDFCIVVVAFFGPLFFLPKVFKWGGAALSAASTAISSNGLIRKGREVGMREIFSGEDSLFQQRSGKAAAGYNPFDRKLRVDNERSKLFLPNKGFLPSKLRGKPLIPVLAGRGLVRAKSGHKVLLLIENMKLVIKKDLRADSGLGIKWAKMLPVNRCMDGSLMIIWMKLLVCRKLVLALENEQ
jgi:hypothetical protein